MMDFEECETVRLVTSA